MRKRSSKLFSRRRHYRRRSPFQLKLKKQTVYTVGAIWLWLIAGTITLSFFSEGPLFVRLREELLVQVGWGMYGLPPFLVTLSFLFFKVKADVGKPNVPFGLGILLFSLMSLTQAGVLGDSLWNLVAGILSAEAAVLLYLTALVIGLMILFNTSLDRVVNFLLVGTTTIVEAIGNLFSGMGAKSEKPLFGQEKLPLKIKGQDEDKLRVVAPVIPPPVPGKPAAAGGKKGELNIGSAMANQVPDMTMWEYPPLSLLSDGPGQKADRGDVKRNANIIENTLESFGITAKVREVNTGPAVTQYAIELATGTKVSKITSLSSDMALALAAPTGQVRIEAPIPGRNLVGIEIPNRGLEFVTLKKMLSSDVMHKAKSKLAVALGLDVSGTPIIADIGKMPHVLVAGTTGSGKSVLINSWIASLLFRTNPSEVRLIMVDPKRVELTGYNGIPHLLTPVIVEIDKILSALRWAMNEMENRYKKFAEVGVRNIDGFNELSGFQAMAYIIIFIDELADLMAYAPVEVEDTICRLAQMARATGIHLVLSTQRPSVDVITGLIKANIPSRIAFNVSSMIDSRVVLDMPGAEKLLGRGDMLYIPADQSKPSRIQGTYVSEAEVEKVVDFLKNKNIQVEYTEEVTTQPVGSLKRGGIGAGGDGRDSLFEEALRLICQHDKASASLLQRRLSVGYARAARILDQLEAAGAIGPGEGSKPRDVLVKNPDEFLAQQAGQ
ncbi:MAG: cell division FtsK/SpoIIIE [Microgenomates group bacterium GW2011_GWC1_49_7]|nr:MAG: cell division FtsK/SpoIIIE [Microgenomates group bacterium GW2011_GWC1_49_7]